MASLVPNAPWREFALGGPATMKRGFGRVLSLVLFCSLVCVSAPHAFAGKVALATITGSVKDNEGKPLAGALISLLKDGANDVIKQTRTGSDGRFSAKILPGRYAIRAVADGFNAVAFASVEVRASQELVYRFNLEPVGSGKTLPERRKDRDDVRWTLRSAQTRRSIFQAQEGEDADIQAVLGNETGTGSETISEIAPESSEATDKESEVTVRGVIETYFASNSYGPGYPGLNFAVATSPGDRIELVFAGQTAAGPWSPERF